MKTYLLGLAIIISMSATAQDQRTTFQNLAVVSTSVGKAVQLSWIKGDEDIAYFVIERSTDGVDFRQCAIVFLSEDPDFTEYRFRDKLADNTHGLLYRIGLVSDQRRIYYLPAKKLVAPVAF